MKLHGNAEILSLYMDGRLHREIQSSLESHLKGCEECRETLAQMQEAKRLISEIASVPAHAALEKEIIAGLPEKKTFSVPLKKIYLPVIGTLAILVVTSLLLYESLNEKQAFQIARTPVPEKRITKKNFDEYVENKKRLEYKPDISAITEKKETAFSKTEEPSLAPAKELAALSDRSQATIEKTDGDTRAKKGRVNGEPGWEVEVVGAPVSVMKSTADEKAGFAYRRPVLNAIVIRNRDEWKKIWDTQNTAQNLSLPLPEVDFREKMVVAIPSRMEDKEYMVINTKEYTEKIVVEYKELPLQKPSHPPYQLNVVNQKPSVELQKVD